MKTLWLLACLAAAALATGAAAVTGEVAAKCPRGQEKTTIAGKSSCRPAASVLPKPRRGDGLAPLLQLALDPVWGETRDGPETLTELVGPETERAVEQAIPRALARMKTLGGRRVLSAVSAATAKCKYSRDLPVTSDSYKEDLGGGAEFEVQTRTGPEGATASLGVTIPQDGGKSVRIRVDLGLCAGERLEVDSCPTVQGVVDGSDNNDGTITVEQLEDGEVVSAQTTKVKIETKLRGQVEDDAKLDSLAIDRVESYNTSVSYGRWLGAEQRITIRRQARVDMRTGRYEPGTGQLDIQQSFHGVLSFLVNESAARAAAIAAAQKASDEAWSAFADEAIKKYRERERNGWQKPNACAKLEFTPKSNTLRVHRGQRGAFSGTVRAEQGGTPEGIWKLTARKRLAVRPSGGRASKLKFDYRVEQDGNVSATFRVTSKAGVADGTWEQGERKLPKRVVGTFSGKTGPNGHYSWSGTIRFLRDPERSEPSSAIYAIENAVFTVTYDVSGTHEGCTGRSESSGSLGRQREGQLRISPEPAGRRGHFYAIALALTAPPGTITVTCGGVTLPPQPWVAVAVFTSIPGTYYSDLKTFSGTNSPVGQVSFTWDLRGST